MRVFLVNQGGAQEVPELPQLAQLRLRVRGWCNLPDSEQNTDWPAVLDVLADSVAMLAAVDPDEAPQLKKIADLTRDDMGTMVGMAAYTSTLIGWTPKALVENFAELNAAIGGWCVAAVMVGAHKTRVDHAVLWRVIESLTADERETIVAQVAALLFTLHLTPDEIRALRKPSTVDTP